MKPVCRYLWLILLQKLYNYGIRGIRGIDFKIICQIVNNLFQSTIIVLHSPTLLVESSRVLFLALCCF